MFRAALLISVLAFSGAAQAHPHNAPSDEPRHHRDEPRDPPYRTHEAGRGAREPMVDLRNPEDRGKPYFLDTSSCGANSDCEPGDDNDNHDDGDN